MVRLEPASDSHISSFNCLIFKLSNKVNYFLQNSVKKAHVKKKIFGSKKTYLQGKHSRMGTKMIKTSVFNFFNTATVSQRVWRQTLFGLKSIWKLMLKDMCAVLETGRKIFFAEILLFVVVENRLLNSSRVFLFPKRQIWTFNSSLCFF